MRALSLGLGHRCSRKSKAVIYLNALPMAQENKGRDRQDVLLRRSKMDDKQTQSHHFLWSIKGPIRKQI